MSMLSSTESSRLSGLESIPFPSPSSEMDRTATIAISRLEKLAEQIPLDAQPLKNASAWYGDNGTERIILGIFSCLFLIPLIFVIQRYRVLSKVNTPEQGEAKKILILQKADSIFKRSLITNNSKEHLQIKFVLAKALLIENSEGAKTLLEEVSRLSARRFGPELDRWLAHARVIQMKDIKSLKEAIVKENSAQRTAISDYFLEKYNTLLNEVKLELPKIIEDMLTGIYNDRGIEIFSAANFSIPELVELSFRKLKIPEYVHDISGGNVEIRDLEFEKQWEDRSQLRDLCFASALSKARTAEDYNALIGFCKRIVKTLTRYIKGTLHLKRTTLPQDKLLKMGSYRHNYNDHTDKLNEMLKALEKCEA